MRRPPAPAVAVSGVADSLRPADKYGAPRGGGSPGVVGRLGRRKRQNLGREKRSGLKRVWAEGSISASSEQAEERVPRG